VNSEKGGGRPVSDEDKLEQTTATTTSTTAEESLPYYCGSCGKRFASLSSLKGHVASTRHVMPSEFRKSVKSTDVDVDKFKPRYEQTPEESSIPDPYQHLKNMLIVFGVNERNANAIVEYMKPYSVDDLYKLVEACQTYMPRSTLKLFVESWANVRHVHIPPEIVERFDINIPPSGYTYSKRPRYEGDSNDMLTLFIAQQKSQTDILLEQVRQQGELIRSLLINRSTNDDSSKNNALESRLQALENELAETRKQLDAERQRRLEQELEALKKEIAELKSRPQTTTAELKKLDIVDKRLEDLTRLFEIIVKSSVEPPSHPKPKESKSSELSIEELESLNIPYIVEEGGEQ
jgi:DNA repair exonuclease SbcCD nuclease subunit